MNQKISTITIGLIIIATIFCSQTFGHYTTEIYQQTNDDIVLTMTYNGEHKTYTLEDLENMDFITGLGGRFNSVGSITGPLEYKGVAISTLANEFSSMASTYSLITFADDGYDFEYSEDNIQGNVQVYDTEGNELRIGGVTMILAYEEEGIKDFPGGPLRVAFVDDEEQLTDSFLWSKHVVEIEFIEITTLNPPIINGPASGNPETKYEYTFVSHDPENLDIYYYVDWSDETNTGWKGPYSSGDVYIESHIWNEKGSYTLKAKAKNTEGIETDWSTLKITMPKNKPSSMIIQFFENHQQLFSFLHQIIGL